MGTPYPVFLRLEGARCLVVGGGRVGTRKVQGLLASGATVTVVSPVVTEAIRELGATISVEERTFAPADVKDHALVIAATDNEKVNATVVEAARAVGVWVNDASSADRSDFMLPATVRHGDLAIAVSTGGGSPAYARLIKDRLEDVFGEEYAEMLNFLAEMRPRVKEALNPAERKAFWDRLVTQETLDRIRSGEIGNVKQMAESWLSS